MRIRLSDKGHTAHQRSHHGATAHRLLLSSLSRAVISCPFTALLFAVASFAHAAPWMSSIDQYILPAAYSVHHQFQIFPSNSFIFSSSPQLASFLIDAHPTHYVTTVICGLSPVDLYNSIGRVLTANDFAMKPEEKRLIHFRACSGGAGSTDTDCTLKGLKDTHFDLEITDSKLNKLLHSPSDGIFYTRSITMAPLWNYTSASIDAESAVQAKLLRMRIPEKLSGPVTVLIIQILHRRADIGNGETVDTSSASVFSNLTLANRVKDVESLEEKDLQCPATATNYKIHQGITTVETHFLTLTFKQVALHILLGHIPHVSLLLALSILIWFHGKHMLLTGNPCPRLMSLTWDPLIQWLYVALITELTSLILLTVWAAAAKQKPSIYVPALITALASAVSSTVLTALTSNFHLAKHELDPGLGFSIRWQRYQLPLKYLWRHLVFLLLFIGYLLLVIISTSLMSTTTQREHLIQGLLSADTIVIPLSEIPAWIVAVIRFGRSIKGFTGTLDGRYGGEAREQDVTQLYIELVHKCRFPPVYWIGYFEERTSRPLLKTIVDGEQAGRRSWEYIPDYHTQQRVVQFYIVQIRNRWLKAIIVNALSAVVLTAVIITTHYLLNFNVGSEDYPIKEYTASKLSKIKDHHTIMEPSKGFVFLLKSARFSSVLLYDVLLIFNVVILFWGSIGPYKNNVAHLGHEESAGERVWEARPGLFKSLEVVGRVVRFLFPWVTFYEPVKRLICWPISNSWKLRISRWIQMCCLRPIPEGNLHRVDRQQMIVLGIDLEALDLGDIVPPPAPDYVDPNAVQEPVPHEPDVDIEDALNDPAGGDALDV